jgi:hypothetical protein
LSTISNHPHPNYSLHRWFGRLAVAGIVAAWLSAVGMVLVAFGLGAGLMLVMIPFLLGLTMPLVLLIALYPGVEVREEGIVLQPNGLPSTSVAWDDVLEVTEHTLLKPPPPSKLKRTAQQGEMVLVQPGAVPFYYRIISLIAGYGGTPVFAISNRTHVDYEALKRVLKKRIPHRKHPSAKK